MLQAFLRTGIMKSKRAPTALHPYGYARDKFIWSLIAAVGIFCIGAGVNIVQGLNALFVEKQLDFLRANMAGAARSSGCSRAGMDIWLSELLRNDTNGILWSRSPL